MPQEGTPVRWRSYAEAVWDPRTGGWNGRSHSVWLDYRGRRIAEERRQWSGGPAPEHRANRLADRLMLAGGAVSLGAILALRLLVR
ncbi:MAG TPA: hypothetical protein GXX28_03845 [Firmicutes bacterium]|nr:hypothetical protein [Bacillota bacterium]